MLLLFFRKKVFDDTNLLIDEKGITVPGYYSAHFIPWESLSGFVIRQDYITIFHKRNKYLQYQVMQSLSDLEITRMNSFCQEHIAVPTNDINNFFNS